MKKKKQLSELFIWIKFDFWTLFSIARKIRLSIDILNIMQDKNKEEKCIDMDNRKNPLMTLRTVKYYA